MLIKVDNREHQLLSDLRLLVAQETGRWVGIRIEVSPLPVGDAIIMDDEGNERLIIERKSLNDFASSIADGRYSEQSVRLASTELHNHNVVYLIEGDIVRYVARDMRSRRPPIDKYALLSAMTSLQYSKGFSVIRTSSTADTALWLLQTACKISRSKLTSFYTDEGAKPATTQEDYVNVVKRVKKDNVTPNNICSIMLCQIPAVSTALAQAISAKYPSMDKLITAIRSDKDALSSIVLRNSKTGKARRPSSQAIANVHNYLLGVDGQIVLDVPL